MGYGFCTLHRINYQGSSCPKCDSGDGGNHQIERGPSAHEIWKQNEAARLERAKRAGRLNTLAHEAWDRRDFTEALRLFQEQQKVIDGPNIREAIAQAEAAIITARNENIADGLRLEANAAYGRGEQRQALSLYHRVLATDPHCLTAEGKKWVQDLERQLQTARSMQQSIESLARSLDAPPSLAGLDFITGDTLVVDARHPGAALPEAVEAAIPDTPAGNRLRKGYQAVQAGDWKVALAWFQDALNKSPGDDELVRLVDLAQHTLNYLTQPQKAGAPAPDPEIPSKDEAVSKPGDPEASPPGGTDYLADEAARKVAVAERAYAAREKYNQSHGEHAFMAGMAARQIAARARSEAAFKQYTKEHGDRAALIFERARATRRAYRGEGFSKEELEAQFQAALFEYYKLIDGRDMTKGVGGSATAEEISLGGKG